MKIQKLIECTRPRPLARVSYLHGVINQPNISKQIIFQCMHRTCCCLVPDKEFYYELKIRLCDETFLYY